MKLRLLGLVAVSGVITSLAAANAHADACEFIRGALRAAHPGKIAIPAGTFVCESSIIVNRSQVELRGAGQDKTILKLADHIHAPLLVIGDDKMKKSGGENIPATHVNDITVSDLTIDGNRAQHDMKKECGEGSCDGNAHSIRNNGITVRGASRVQIENVTSHSAISGGLVTEKHCDHLHVRNFKSFDNNFDGFAGYQTEDSMFENLELAHNRSAGVSIDIRFNRNTFLNSKIEKNGDVGIFSRNNDGNRFDNVQILGNGSHGVFMADAGSPATCVVNNVYNSVTITGNRGTGFRLASVCAGNAITGRSVIAKNGGGCMFAAQGARVGMDRSVVCKR